MAFVGLSLQNTRFSGAVRLLLFRREWTNIRCSDETLETAAYARIGHSLPPTAGAP